MKKPKRTRILSARERLPGGVTSSQDLKRLSKQIMGPGPVTEQDLKRLSKQEAKKAIGSGKMSKPDRKLVKKSVFGQAIGSGKMSKPDRKSVKKSVSRKPKSKTKKAIAPWRRRRDAEGHALYGRGRIRKDYSGIGRLKGY